MEILTEEGLALLARWVHILAAITWVGLLYYFNFVQAPFLADSAPRVHAEVTRRLVPHALHWFRHAASVTLLTGLVIILINIDQVGWANWGKLLSSPYGVVITTGMGLGTLMFLNVWCVIWPKLKDAGAGSQTADRRAWLASRTNVVFSIPTVFFMATANHLTLFTQATARQKVAYGLLAGGVISLLELNALVGKTGWTKRPLETTSGVLLSGFGLWAVIYGLLTVTTP